MSQVFPAITTAPALGHNSDTNHSTPMENEKGITRRVPTLNSSAVVTSFTTPAGAAGADLVASGAGFAVVPAGHKFYVLSVDIIAHAASAGIDAGNTCLIALTNITTGKNVAVKTFSNTVVYPAKDGVANITLDPDLAQVNAGEVLGLTVTQGATADHNGFTIQVGGILEKA